MATQGAGLISAGGRHIHRFGVTIAAPRGACRLFRRGGVSMSQVTSSNRHKAVKCMFCGIRTPLPESKLKAEIRVSIVRCHRCGREAPYPED